MAKKPDIVISADDLGDEPSSPPARGEVIRIGLEDLVEGAAITVTAEDIAEDDLRALFRPPLMRQFLAFVDAGLPEVFARSHPELVQPHSREQIRAAIDRVPDPALKKHLAGRLAALQRLQASQGGRA
jgi:hypothetical protein